MKTTRLLKGSNLARFEDKVRYSEMTYKQELKTNKRVKELVLTAKAKKAQLKAELEEVNYLLSKYENLELHSDAAKREAKNWLDATGHDYDANRRETEKAYYEYQELECYVGRNPMDHSYRRVGDNFIP
jgi:hypothetical protein